MKQKTVYLCSDCGYESPKWFGKCPSCGAWNTMSEYKVKPESAARGTDTFQRGVSRPTLLKDIDSGDESRFHSGIGRPCCLISTLRPNPASSRASENWIECWAAARCTVHLFWWAVNRASANPRCCCKCVRKCANLRESCMFRERNLFGRSSCARRGFISRHPICIFFRKPTWIKSLRKPNRWPPIS